MSLISCKLVQIQSNLFIWTKSNTFKDTLMNSLLKNLKESFFNFYAFSVMRWKCKITISVLKNSKLSSLNNIASYIMKSFWFFSYTKTKHLKTKQLFNYIILASLIKIKIEIVIEKVLKNSQIFLRIGSLFIKLSKCKLPCLLWVKFKSIQSAKIVITLGIWVNSYQEKYW